MSFDRQYLVWALGYAVIGMCLGIVMAASHNHGEFVTHAHILLVGFVLSIAYGIIHKLWLGQPNPILARIQFIVHQAAAVILSVGLFLLYGNLVAADRLEPVLASASVVVLIGALLMMYMVLRARVVKA